MNILITRHRDQCIELDEQLKNAGYTLFYFPTFEIKPIPTAFSHPNILYDILIFFSPHAVIHAPLALKKNYASVPVFAIGSGTAKQLKKEGFLNIHYPTEGNNSEGLLQLAAFKDIRNQKILLIQGKDGRGLVQCELLKKGAQADCCIVYERISMELNLDLLDAILRENKIHVAIITSETSFQDLKIQLNSELKATLLKIPTIVISERLKKIAENLSYHSIYSSRSLEFFDLMNTLSKIPRNTNV